MVLETDFQSRAAIYKDDIAAVSALARNQRKDGRECGKRGHGPCVPHDASVRTKSWACSVVFAGVVMLVRVGIACSSMDIAPNTSKYDVRNTLAASHAKLEGPQTDELRWREQQTRASHRPETPPPVPPPPPVELWPDGSVPAFCRDVAKMTLEEYQWCVTKNHWNDELEHVPMGWPKPPLMEPVWWWQGYDTRWAPLGLSNKINEFRCVRVHGVGVMRACSATVPTSVP